MSEAEQLPEAAIEAPRATPPVGPLLRSRLSGADYFRTVHVACVEQGTSEDRLTDPDFWKMVAGQLQMNDRIEVYCEAGSFFAELMVRTVGTNIDSVQMLRIHHLSEAKPPNADDLDYEVKWLGAYTKYGIVRKSDKAVIRENILTEEVAYRELRDLTTALNR